MAKTKLDRVKIDIESYFDATGKRIYKYSDLRQMLTEQRKEWQLKPPTRISEFKDYLITNTKLKKTTLQFPSRMETRYRWGEVSDYEFVLSLKPNSYLTHHSAAYLHGLTTKEPTAIYLNHEQSPKPISNKALAQERIDAAFKKPVRATRNMAQYKGKTIHILNGMHTGYYGVASLSKGQAKKIRLTDIERTIIDISVRPVYSGGVHEVLDIYRRASAKISPDNLVETLVTLNYTYPYHQVIGYYLEKAGVYEKSAAEWFLEFGLEYDFYLTHQMNEPTYSAKWRLYYPKNLGT